MKRVLSSVGAVALILSACAPDIPNTPVPTVVVAQFDPAAATPVVPKPNDLATDPKTGLLSVPVPADASGADQAFYAWLNTLDGFPSAATAQATFSAPLDPASVTATSVRVLDVTDGFAAVTTTAVASTLDDAGVVTVTPPSTGWTSGHTYAVALVGGASGLKGADGSPVVGSATWALARVSKSLVTCTDFTSPDCRATTELIPSTVTGDDLARQLDQAKTALKLEALRLKYKPVVDAVVAAGVAREDLALAWTFKVASGPEFVWNPAATPPAVPTPTDLAKKDGRLNIPVDPTSSPANQEFTTDYLNTLNGFPPSAAANASVTGALDHSTVTQGAFKVLVLKGAPLSGQPTFVYDEATKTFTITPAGGSWGRSRTIAIAAIAGGLKGQNGLALQASSAWALARSAAPLVDCDMLSPSCNSLITAAPVTTEQAIALEQVRRGYKPVLDALAAGGLPRSKVVGLWVFSTLDQPQVTFDLAAATPVIPFPANQFLRSTDDTATSGRLTFPAMQGPAAALFAGLNTLDGFSLTAPIVSENADTLGALDEDAIDPATLDGGVGFAKLDGAGSLTPDVKACLDCASSTGGATTPPQQLQWVPRLPLEPLTRYAAWVTSGLKDSKGRPAAPAQTFALVRLKNPLLGSDGHTTIPLLSDEQATALEPYRLKFKGCLDRIEATGVARKDISLGFCVTTESTVSTVQLLSGAVAQTPASVLPDSPTMLVPVTTQVKAVMGSLGIPQASIDAIGNVYAGAMILPWGLSSTTGTLVPNPQVWTARKAPFTLYVPAACPMGGCPVVIFGHGLTRNRNDAIVIAGTFARAGLATIAIDVVHHGDRSTCVGSKAVTMASTDDAACADPLTQTCDASSGRCIARDQANALACNPATNGDAVCFSQGKGFCQFQGPNAGKCEGGDFLRNATSGEVVISSWNFLDLVNLFATRDNFRYTGSIDFTALVRLMQSSANTSLKAQLALLGETQTLDTGTIHYAGQSLGSFNGSVFSAASPVANRMALNVPGSSQVDVLLTAPAFSAQRTGFLNNLAGLGLTPGTPGFDQFIVLARTILDPADPRNLIYAGVNSSNMGRKLYFQSIEGDEVLPNPTADALIAAAGQNPARPIQTFRFTEANGDISAAFPTSRRHGFLLSPAGNPDCTTMPTARCATAVAQSKLTTFLVTGVAP